MDERQRDYKQAQSSSEGMMPWHQVAQTASATTSADNSSTGPIPYLIAIATMLILTVVLYFLFGGIHQLLSTSFDEFIAEYGDVRPFSDDNTYGDLLPFSDDNTYGDDELFWDYYSDSTIDAKI